MAMIKKSITVTAQQDNWIKAQIETGHYGNESEIMRELIRERQIREEETAKEIAAVRTMLVKGEKSIEQKGYSDKSIDKIWQDAKTKHKINNG